MKALILGATGATGRELVKTLLNDPLYTEVHAFVRTNRLEAHPRLSVHVVDFEQPDSWRELVQGDVAFSCLGTTVREAGGEAQQRRVDVDYQEQFAQMAHQAGVATFVLQSSAGADAASRYFYMKIKGEVEDYVLGLKFPRTLIFRPGILDRGERTRLGERLSLVAIKGLNAIGLMKQYAPLKTSTLAEKMVRAVALNMQQASCAHSYGMADIHAL